MKASKILKTIRKITNESFLLETSPAEIRNQQGGDIELLFSLRDIVSSVMKDNRLKSLSNWSLTTKVNRNSSSLEVIVNADCLLLPNEVLAVEISFVFTEKNVLYLLSSYEGPKSGRWLLLSGRKWQVPIFFMEDIELYVKKWLLQVDRVLRGDIKHTLRMASY